jgi:proline iminopeptidase
MLATILFTALAFQETPKEGVPNFDIPIHGKGQFCESKYGKIYYESEGSGPVVILVAGGPGSNHTSFHPYFSRLAKNHTVIYMDSIGRGRSDRLKDPRQYTVQRDGEDIEILREHLKADKVAVIGHSYGGMPALAFAQKYPKSISHLVLSDTLHSKQGFQQNIDACNTFVQFQYPELWAQLMEMRKRGVLSGSDEYSDPYNGPLNQLYFYDQRAGSRLFRSGDPKDGFNGLVYQTMLGPDSEWKVNGTLNSFDARKRMKDMHMPVLICVGRYDRVAIPRLSYEMKTLLPEKNSKLLIFEKSGHRPWLEESDAYFSAVGEFLKQAG